MKKAVDTIVTKIVEVCDSCEKNQDDLKRFLLKFYCKECRAAIKALDVKKKEEDDERPPLIPATYEEASQFLRAVDPNILIWKIKQTHTADVGDRAGHADQNYKYVSIWGKVQKVDEIFHLLKFKKYPNAKPYCEYKNSKNSKGPKPFNGIYYRKDRNKWEAKFKTTEGKVKQVGTYNTEAEARAAQRDAIEKQMKDSDQAFGKIDERL